jgi:4-hydroxy-2-oxoheptanedioate aldolase
MPVRENRIRKVWRDGRRAINFWAVYPSVGTAQLVARSRYDSVLFDMQHGAFDFKDICFSQIALGDSEMTSLVRVPDLDPGLIMRLIDNGIEGVLCPAIDTREQAEAFVGACRYPPNGYRSIGPGLRALRDAERAEYFAAANESIVTFAIIESVTAIENLESICATPGLDAVFIGPVDLSMSGGGPPIQDYTDPVAKDRHERIVSTCHAAGIKVGMPAYTARALQTVIEWGADIITSARDDSLIVAGAERLLDETLAAIAAVESGQPVDDLTTPGFPVT